MSDDEFTITQINNISLKKELNYDERIKIFEGIVNGYDTPEVHYLKLHFEKILEEYKEIKELKKEINFLKAHLGKDETEWIIKRDLATRTNRIPNEPNDFGFPLDFDEEKVHHLRPSEKNPNWCYFEYYYNNDFPSDKYWEYDMPWSLYKFLEEKQKRIIDVSSIKTVDDMKRYIYSIGEIPRGDYFTVMGNFILKRRGKIFDVEELDDECKFNTRKTRRDTCKRFIEWDFIKEMKTQGKYKVIF